MHHSTPAESFEPGQPNKAIILADDCGAQAAEAGEDGKMDIELLEKAEQAFREGQNQLAYEILADLLGREPDNTRALLDQAVVCHSLGRAEEAISTFEALLRLDEAHLEARRSLSVALASLRRWPEAEAHLAHILERQPEDHALWAYLAKVVKAQGRREEALAHLERAIRLAPRNLEYVGLRDELGGRARPGEVKKKLRLVACCTPGMDNFIHGGLRGLEPHMRTRAVVSGQPAEHLEAIKAANVVWLEWGNQLAEHISKQHESLAGKQVIVRIHSYEVLDGLADRIDFSRITDIVFVSRLIRDLFLARRPEVAGQCRIHVIHNGIDLKKFSFVPRGDSRKHIAFLTYINHKKDPMVLMQAFAHLHRRHPEIKLHIAGKFQDSRYELAMPHFLNETGLLEAATFYGYINNAHEWLKGMDFICSSSLMESQGVGILEAMSRGCRPLIYNFPGARDLYLPNQLWTTFEDLEDRFLNGPSPEEVSAFVARYYSQDREIGGYLKVILDKEQVDKELVDEEVGGHFDLSVCQKWARTNEKPASAPPAAAPPKSQTSSFKSSAYWENRYAARGNSGAGSYGRLAEFKAEVLNAFVKEHGIERVMEFGSGDGNQLSFFRFKQYTGFDVSRTALELTRKKFAGDAGKTFLHVDEYSGQTAELALSLDVIYHLVEDEVFDAYMRRLFAAAEKYVVIYASNEEPEARATLVPHVRHRKFTAWVAEHQKNWECIRHIPNRYPLPPSPGPQATAQDTSFADFHIFARRNAPDEKNT
jgi:glycosyltransferase involved in cell wall biosynthesis